MKLLIFAVASLWHVAASAEVSDKFLTVSGLLFQGAVIAVIGFILGRLRWLLSLLLLPIPILLFLGTYSLWHEEQMRLAILNEMGVAYFYAMLLADSLASIGVVAGGVMGWRRQKKL